MPVVSADEAMVPLQRLSAANFRTVKNAAFLCALKNVHFCWERSCAVVAVFAIQNGSYLGALLKNILSGIYSCFGENAAAIGALACFDWQVAVHVGDEVVEESELIRFAFALGESDRRIVMRMIHRVFTLCVCCFHNVVRARPNARFRSSVLRAHNTNNRNAASGQVRHT